MERVVRFDTLGTTFIPRIFEAKDWANLFENFEDLCREGKILDLSQADTTYYQVHKIQQIAKHRVLLLDFVITTQKPMEIFQVSCKKPITHQRTCKWWHKPPPTCKRWHKQPRTCKRWHKQSSACKRWHKQTNQAMTCVTHQTSSRVAHPPTSWRRSRLRSPETLLEPSFEASKNFNFEYKEYSKRNHPNHLPRSQRSLELSSKASKNLNKPQIGEALQIQFSKALKNFYHKPSNTKNIRRWIIQIIFLDLKVHWNQAQKPPETSTNHKLVKLYEFKSLKHRRTSTTNP